MTKILISIALVAYICVITCHELNGHIHEGNGRDNKCPDCHNLDHGHKHEHHHSHHHHNSGGDYYQSQDSNDFLHEQLESDDSQQCLFDGEETCTGHIKEKYNIHYSHHSNHNLSEDNLHPYLAIFLTFVSAMSSFVGGLILVLYGFPSKKFLGHMFSFASGVMLYISYMDILKHAEADIGDDGLLYSNIGYFLGVVFFYIIIRFVPKDECDFDNQNGIVTDDSIDNNNVRDDNVKNYEDKSDDSNNDNTSSGDQKSGKDKRSVDNLKDNLDHNHLISTGIIASIGVALHNLPEGLIVYNSTIVGFCNLTQPKWYEIMKWSHYLVKCSGRGIAVMWAIGLHNIPEGIIVTVPLYMATKDRYKSLKYCFLTSLAEPLGAIILGYLFYSKLTVYLMGILNSFVSGIMIILCFGELIPSSLHYLSPLESVASNMAGQFVMFLSIQFLIKVNAH